MEIELVAALRPVLAAFERMVLNKLEWFRAGDEISERQWNDVIGVLKVWGSRMNRDYLVRWANEIGVADLLSRALEEAGFAGN